MHCANNSYVNLYKYIAIARATIFAKCMKQYFDLLYFTVTAHRHTRKQKTKNKN